MSVLRVRAYLSAPVALSEPLHLDAIAASCAPGVRGQRLTRTCDAADIVRPRLPIASVTCAGHEVYVCSAAEVAPDAQRSREHLTRRRDGTDLDYLSAPVDTRSGPGRDVMLPVSVWLTPYVEWWAVGDRRGVRKLVERRTTHVGALRRHGYGAVREWAFERMDGTDPIGVLVTCGRARRNLPTAWCTMPELVERVPVSPPYWHPSTVVDGVLAGRHTDITDDVRGKMAGLC